MVLSSRAVTPDFKVLLYPHQPGAPLPEMTRKDGCITIDLPNQSDRFTFMERVDGREAFVINRNNGEWILSSGMHRLEENDFSFSCDSKGKALNLLRQGDVLFLSGAGWKKATIRTSTLLKIVSIGSVGEIKHTDTTIEVT